MMKTAKHIASLPKVGMSCLDGDDFMMIMNTLMVQKETLQNEIQSKVVEIGTWIQILQSSETQDIQELFDTLPNTSNLTTQEKKLLMEYHRVCREINWYSFLGTCQACSTEDGGIILLFTSSKYVDSSEFLICLTTTADGAYSVKKHSLPDTIPVSELEKKYLQDKEGTDKVLRKFVTSVDQYMWPLFNRLQQAQEFKNINIPKLSKHVYRNEGLTLMSFALTSVEDEQKVRFQFVLNYSPLNILPHEVRIDYYSTETPPPALKDSMNDLALEMKDKPFIDVLKLKMQSPVSSQRTGHTSPNSEFSSSSTDLFEIF